MHVTWVLRDAQRGLVGLWTGPSRHVTMGLCWTAKRVLEVTAPASRVWAVGALARALGEALAERFNPVSVKGEVSGFTRAASGHCYFTLKDEGGQLRCAMFRRSAQAVAVDWREGLSVEVLGQLPPGAAMLAVSPRLEKPFLVPA